MGAGWVADVARVLRSLTSSLFPPYRIRADPVSGAAWTSTRLVAGYMLMCDNQDVALVYCELHTHWDFAAAFAVYEDECCDTRVMHVSMGVHTCISERVGVDCSCFSIDGHHFSARTSAEKSFWLRAISNVKVKLRHRTGNPSVQELAHYRASVAENARFIKPDSCEASKPVLQRRERIIESAYSSGKSMASAGAREDSVTATSAPSPRTGGGPGGMWSGGGLKVPESTALLPQSSPCSPPICEEPQELAPAPNVVVRDNHATVIPDLDPTVKASTPRSNASGRGFCPIGRTGSGRSLGGTPCTEGGTAPSQDNTHFDLGN